MGGEREGEAFLSYISFLSNFTTVYFGWQRYNATISEKFSQLFYRKLVLRFHLIIFDIYFGLQLYIGNESKQKKCSQSEHVHS